MKARIVTFASLREGQGEGVALFDEPLTEYGTVNADEAFAEAFRLYVDHGPGALGPQWRAEMERALEASGMPLRKSHLYVPLQKSGGPFVGPKGGLYADAAHTIPWSKNKHGEVKPHSCPRCKGVAHVLARQTVIGGRDEVSASPCRACNPRGKIKLDPKKVKAAGLPMPTPKKKAPPPEPENAVPRRQMGLDFKAPEQVSMFKSPRGYQDLSLEIERDKGEIRTWKGPDGAKGQTVMVHPYGYLKGSKGADGEELDVYVGPDEASPTVFVINQSKVRDARQFDEHKVMLGFRTEDEAREAYLAHYGPELGPKLLGTIRTWSMDRFRRWVDSRRAQKDPARKSHR